MKPFAKIATLVGIGALMTSLSVGGLADASPSVKLPLPAPHLNTIAPSNTAVAALMPRGPQTVTAAVRVGSAKTAFVAYDARGYINFTGSGEAGCSSDITLKSYSNTSAKPGYISQSVRPAYGQTYERSLTTAAGRQVVGAWSFATDPGLGIPMPAPATIDLFGARQMGTGYGIGFCMFTEMSRYTSFAPGNTGALHINLNKLSKLNRAAGAFFDTEIVNYLHPIDTKAATRGVALLGKIPSPELSGLMSAVKWTIVRKGDKVVFRATNGKYERETITFAPTTARAVPHPHIGSFMAYMVKNLLSLDGKGSAAQIRMFLDLDTP